MLLRTVNQTSSSGRAVAEFSGVVRSSMIFVPALMTTESGAWSVSMFWAPACHPIHTRVIARASAILETFLCTSGLLERVETCVEQMVVDLEWRVPKNGPTCKG